MPSKASIAAWFLSQNFFHVPKPVISAVQGGYAAALGGIEALSQMNKVK
jgi:hypothetical protein